MDHSDTNVQQPDTIVGSERPFNQNETDPLDEQNSIDEDFELLVHEIIPHSDDLGIFILTESNFDSNFYLGANKYHVNMYVNPEHYMKLGYTTSEVTTTGLTKTPDETPLPTTMATSTTGVQPDTAIPESQSNWIDSNPDFDQIFSSTAAYHTNFSSPAVIETLEPELLNSTSTDGYITTEEASIASTTIPGISTTTSVDLDSTTTTISTLVCSPKFCDTTKWTSRDKPSGTGDHERF